MSIHMKNRHHNRHSLGNPELRSQAHARNNPEDCHEQNPDRLSRVVAIPWRRVNFGR